MECEEHHPYVLCITIGPRFSLQAPVCMGNQMVTSEIRK